MIRCTFMCSFRLLCTWHKFLCFRSALPERGVGGDFPGCHTPKSPCPPLPKGRKTCVQVLRAVCQGRWFHCRSVCDAAGTADSVCCCFFSRTISANTKV